ncbi:MAG: sugar phosphate isomerase/epimerase [Elusimicrobia bacterium]|nr:sugar phosphate isomerase/epimerase [Elusimicrobiota bacterium]
MSAALAVMQGRLSPPEGGRIQSFPARGWRDEFARARDCGLDRIEWIVDEPDWEANPLLSREGRAEIAALARRTGVEVRSACADLFMVHPLHSAPPAELSRRRDMLARIIAAAGEAGLEHIDIPFVDASAIKDGRAFAETTEVLRAAAPEAERRGVLLCLETSLEPVRFRSLLEAVGHPAVRANHDIGNSASLGYAPAEEFSAIGRWVSCVHIKDRRRGGGTVPLGTGDSDFAGAFAQLKACGYGGHFVLQAARGPDEVGWTKRNAAFARRWMATLKPEGHGPTD